MKPRPKILLACPISKEKEYVLYGWLNYIKKLSYSYDLYLVDNSRSQNWHTSFENKAKIKVIHVDTFGKNVFKRMLKSYDVILDYFFAKKFDYLFSLECDIFPPLDIIEQLLAMNKPVASACYFIGTGDNQSFMLQNIETEGLPPFETTNKTLNESFLFCNGQIKQVFHAGLGCALIHKSVFKKVKFRLSEAEPTVHPDTFFAKDCFAHNIPIFVDTSIICRHKNQAWTNLIKT